MSRAEGVRQHFTVRENPWSGLWRQTHTYSDNYTGGVFWAELRHSPLPDSNFLSVLKSSVPHTTHVNTPSSLTFTYLPVQALNVGKKTSELSSRVPPLASAHLPPLLDIEYITLQETAPMLHVHYPCYGVYHSSTQATLTSVRLIQGVTP